ncbi:MAG: HEAT repeat domain-containing protein [Myxococcales bacterium]|nr:HEAT repeat domain-containing protein [Myxococcales bacterium]MBK7198355.1 HEAT repeat domain-containing protein [Myxococcales bacterium]MBP6846889.1 HEAT repeat domain-containing protein [Kofleriaceae bacterium]
MALGARGGAAARATLEALLDHADQRVRCATVVAMIDLGPAPSRAALKRRRALEPDREVRTAIRKALAHLTPRR